MCQWLSCSFEYLHRSNEQLSHCSFEYLNRAFYLSNNRAFLQKKPMISHQMRTLSHMWDEDTQKIRSIANEQLSHCSFEYLNRAFYRSNEHSNAQSHMRCDFISYVTESIAHLSDEDTQMWLHLICDWVSSSHVWHEQSRGWFCNIYSAKETSNFKEPTNRSRLVGSLKL